MQKKHTPDKDQTRRRGTQSAQKARPCHGKGHTVILSAPVAVATGSRRILACSHGKEHPVIASIAEPFGFAQGKLRGAIFRSFQQEISNDQRKNVGRSALSTARRAIKQRGSLIINALKSTRGHASLSLRARMEQSGMRLFFSIILRSNLIVNALQSNRAFALVISLGLVALITVFAIGVSQSMSASMRTAANIEQATEAYYAAEAALETGLLENKDKDAGYEASVKCDETGTCDDLAKGINYTDLTTANGSYASWTIQGRTTCLDTNPLKNTTDCADDDTYYIPYPGTGTAGTTCDPLVVYTDSNNDGTEDADHACNWGKLRYGENVSIPLYITDPTDPSKVINPSDTTQYGLQNFTLKVRTPCANGEGTCDTNARYVMDTDDDFGGKYYGYRQLLGGGDDQGDTIILWQIIGECEVYSDAARTTLLYTEPCYLLPRTDYKGDPDFSRRSYNSEIYEQLINIAGNNIVLQSPDSLQSQGVDQNSILGYIKDFLDNKDQCLIDCYNPDPIAPLELQWTYRLLKKPVLKLSVVHSLVNNTGGGIPYLEYQLILEADNTAPSDVYQTIIGEGYSGNFKQSIEIKKGKETGVLNFVIQN